MTEKPMHPIDALHDAVSGRLTGPLREGLDRHLSECESCRREFEVLDALRRKVTEPADAAIPIPLDLEARLRRVLDAEDRASEAAAPIAPAPTPTAGWPRRWMGWATAAMAAAAVLAIVWSQWRPPGPRAPVEVASDLRRYAAGTLPVDTRTSDPAVLERRLAAADLGFAARVFDFGAMNHQLTGGGIHSVGGSTSALFVYDGPDDLRLLCEMYLGSVNDLPSPAERRTNEGIEFLVYREGDVTVVFWQEADGRVVCALAANGDPETAVRFAFAKAIGS